MLALKNLGHTIYVVSPKDEQGAILNEHFNYIALKNLSRKGLNPLRDILLFWELFKVYRELQPDIIFQYTIKPNIYGSFAAFFTRRNAISFVTGLGYVFTNQSILRGFVILLYRLAAYCSKKLVFLNQDDFDDYIRHGIVTAKKAELVPGEGVDVEHFRPLEKKHFHEVSEGSFVFIGRLLVDKGIRHLLYAAKKIKLKYPRVSFKIVGGIDTDNPMAIEESELTPYIDSKVIQYIGEVQDVRDYLEEADALILPSYAEGLSRVILESLSMGTPVVCTDVRGCNTIVKDGDTGLLIPIDNLIHLDKVIERFLALTPAQRQNMGSNGRQLVLDRYSSEQIINWYVNCITTANNMKSPT